MSVLFDMVKKLFGLKKLTEVGVENAVTKEWINETEKNEILGVETTTETPVEDPVVTP